MWWMRRRKGIAAALGLVAVLAVAGGVPVAWGTQAGRPVPFIPYADVTLWPPLDLAATAEAGGVDELTLAFVQSNGTCAPHWGGVIELADDHMGPEIDALRARGGDVIVSFGGAAGVELAQACTSSESLASAYASVADQYGVRRLDFDIEGAAVAETASIVRRSSALASLEQDFAARGTDLEISLTLPALPTGLTADGIAVVRAARDAGVDVDVVNIMAMDYGDAAAPNPADRMGDYAIQAATSLHAQLASLYPTRPDAELWSMVGITPMIGQNDVVSEVLTPEDAAEIATFADRHRVGRVSMWSVHRDKPCPGGPTRWASATCSGIDAPAWAFSSAFLGQTPPSSTTAPPSTTAPTTTAPPPTTTPSPSDDGLDLRIDTTTDWGSGYCAAATIHNTATTSIDWTVTFTVDGTISSLWNGRWSQTDGRVSVSGLPWNDVVQPADSVGFGFCANRDASPPTTAPPTSAPTTTSPPTTSPPQPGMGAKTVLTSDWGSGYCAEVSVSNSSSTAVAWNASLRIEGRITSLWDAIWTQSGTTLSARGRPWNETLPAGGTTHFGFCATR